MSRCQLIVTSCVWKNYCGSPWGHTICYSVHKSAVSEVMQCWWLCCRADGRREVGDSFWTSGWLVRARSEQLPKFAHRRFQDQSSRFSRRWAGSNFLDRIVRGLWQQYRTSHHSIQFSLSVKTKAWKMMMGRWQRRRRTSGRSRTRRTSRTWRASWNRPRQERSLRTSRCRNSKRRWEELLRTIRVWE